MPYAYSMSFNRHYHISLMTKNNILYISTTVPQFGGRRDSVPGSTLVPTTRLQSKKTAMIL